MTDQSATSELIVTGTVRDGITRWLLTTDGSAKEQRFLLETGGTSGKVRVHYDMYTIGDKLVVYYPAGGSKVIDTKGAVLNSKIVTGVYGPATSTAIEVVVNEGGGSSGSAWILNDVSVERPGGLVKLGSRMLSLRGDGTYSGAGEIREGTLRAQNDTALGLKSSGTFATQQTYTDTPTTVSTGAKLELTGSIADLNGGIAAGIQVWNELLVLNSPGYQVAVAGVTRRHLPPIYGPAPRPVHRPALDQRHRRGGRGRPQRPVQRRRRRVGKVTRDRQRLHGRHRDRPGRQRRTS